MVVLVLVVLRGGIDSVGLGLGVYGVVVGVSMIRSILLELYLFSLYRNCVALSVCLSFLPGKPGATSRRSGKRGATAVTLTAVASEVEAAVAEAVAADSVTMVTTG